MAMQRGFDGDFGRTGGDLMAIESPKVRFQGARANCEDVPRLRAADIRHLLERPQGVWLRWLWKSRVVDEVEEAATIRRLDRSGEDHDSVVPILVEGRDWSDKLLVHRRPLPNDGQVLLVECPGCQRLRRHLYLWSLTSEGLRAGSWRCRDCAGLRFSSEGRYRTETERVYAAAGLRVNPRPEPWDAEIYIDGDDAEPSETGGEPKPSGAEREPEGAGE
jgi:hypothetical protein